MCVHAAGESSPGGLPEGTHAVVLSTPDEQALLAVEARLKLAQAQYVAIREPDRNNELMAIGLVPGKKEVVGRYVSSLPLLK
jgi:hypothetical protein